MKRVLSLMFVCLPQAMWLGCGSTTMDAPAPPGGQGALHDALTSGAGGDQPFFFSLAEGDTVNGVAIRNEDIAFFDGANVSLFFDGSDVGLEQAVIDAFALLPNQSIAMSFTSPLKIDGVGNVDDSDVVLFVPSSLGPITTGTFQPFFSGASIGLNQGSEDIDAIEVVDNDLFISTLGNFSVAGLSGSGSDVFRCSGFNTSPQGGCESIFLYFDGSDVGLKGRSENVDAVAIFDNLDIVLSVARRFSVEGLSGPNEDAFLCDNPIPGEETTTCQTFSRFFEGDAHTLAGNITGIDVSVFPQPGQDGGAGEGGDGGVGLPVQEFNLQVFLFREIHTCFIGDPCLDGTCLGLNRDGQKAVLFDDAFFVSVSPQDPILELREEEVCLTLTLSDAEVLQLTSELNRFVSDTAAFTEDTLILNMQIIEIGPVDLALDRAGDGFWISPGLAQGVLLPHLTEETDFHIVSHGILDNDSGLYFDLPACGLTFGADLGLAGAGYSWVPKSSPAFFFECADHGVYTHEWLHQVEFSVWVLSNFTDIYLDPVTLAHNYPPCGQGDPDPLKWFPTTHECTTDPDSPNCGGICASNDVINEHILREHFNPELPLVTNHCTNGIQDFLRFNPETGVDVGGNCLP